MCADNQLQRNIDCDKKGVKCDYITSITKAGNIWVPQFIESLDQQNCVGCGRCYKACTRQVIEIVTRQPTKGKATVERVARIAHPGECIGDAACEAACPRKNITCRSVKK